VVIEQKARSLPSCSSARAHKVGGVCYSRLRIDLGMLSSMTTG
jgi:hypothetical protein